MLLRRRERKGREERRGGKGGKGRGEEGKGRVWCPPHDLFARRPCS